MIFVVSLVELLGLVLFIGLLLFWGSISLSEWFKQNRCNHDGGVHETRACDAICKLCGKNLGFIGTEENEKRRRQ